MSAFTSDGETFVSGTGRKSCFRTTDGELAAIRSRIHAFIEKTVLDAGARGVVVPMSGGIDSTLTATLAVEALGSDAVVGLSLPCTKADDYHATDARTVADGLGIDFRELQLKPLLSAFESTVKDVGGSVHPPDATGNAIARLRMLCAYYTANAESRLVCGTGNRSELLLGYFTKYGDGGADAHPLGDLYKTEVRALAHHIGLPRRIIEKEPTAGLEPGQTDRTDLEAGYSTIDTYLRLLIDSAKPFEVAMEESGLDPETAAQLTARCLETQHKRALPPTAGIGVASGDRPAYTYATRLPQGGDQ